MRDFANFAPCNSKEIFKKSKETGALLGKRIQIFNYFPLFESKLDINRYSDFPIISTVPIKGTVLKFSISSLISVQYNLKKQWFFY